jgi:putative Mn2+ efflux pump MntP
LFATFRFRDIKIPEIFHDPSYLLGFAVLVILGIVMIWLPLANAGNPDDPAPPAVMM